MTAIEVVKRRPLRNVAPVGGVPNRQWAVRIRTIRYAAGYTDPRGGQKKFAEFLGTNTTTQYGNWERVDQDIPVEWAIRLIERVTRKGLHGLTLDYIYRGIRAYIPWETANKLDAVEAKAEEDTP